MIDSEQCSNRLKLYLISLLVNFACELGQIMTRYDSEQCSNRLQLDLMLILDNFLAPPAERQRSFSNADSSVVRRRRRRRRQLFT